MRALTLAKLTSNGRYGRGAGQLRGGLGLGMRNCGGCQPSCSGTTMRPRPNAENDVPSNVTNDRVKRNRFMFHWTAGVEKCSRNILTKKRLLTQVIEFTNECLLKRDFLRN